VILILRSKKLCQLQCLWKYGNLKLWSPFWTARQWKKYQLLMFLG
jgi:hypothetical protein